MAVIVAACITALTGHARADAVRRVEKVDGWAIKARTNGDGKFLACSMERFFVANKGEGRFRINIIAWPTSTMVFLRGNDGFLGGAGVAQFEIVSDTRELYSGSIRFKKSEVLFALNGVESRRDVTESRGWSIYKDGERVARFPMDGAAAAMRAMERCAGLSDPTDVATAPDTPAPPTEAPIESGWQSTAEPVSQSVEDLASKTTLQIMARQFSTQIGRSDVKSSQFRDGVLQWSYGDDITTGAATIARQPLPARAYAASLAIRPDQCDDSVLTLPMSEGTLRNGRHAMVVSMCRGPSSVTVRHVHVATLGEGTTYVLNYETQASPDGRDMPERSDVLSDAFAAAFAAAAGG